MAIKYTKFPKKVLLKWNKELLELHKRVITTYLSSIGVSYPTRRKFFKLYDAYITEENIKDYFYTPTSLLIKALVLNTLDKVYTYRYLKLGKRKKRKTK